MALNLSNKLYKELFKQLVAAYYDGSFDDKVHAILEEHSENQIEAMKIISVICGVDVEPDSDDFVITLKKAITNYKVKENIVQKVMQCEECVKNENGKTRCQSICPFDAIVDEPLEKNLIIDPQLCTNCGLCVDVCERGHLKDRIEFLPIADLMKNDQKVIAAVAPAIAGQFGEGVKLDQLRAAFVRAGFADMIEVAFAADMLTIKEAVEFDRHVKGEGDLLITSCCCPMWVAMLRKVYTDLVKHVSPSVSPMIAIGKILKQLNPDVKVVFVGPCIAKKSEAKEKDLVGIIDFVLTFEEVRNLFDALEIKPSELTGMPSMEYASRGGRLYAVTGGVSMAVSEAVSELFPNKKHLLKAVQANGVLECKELLKRAVNGEVDATFIEGMGCIGGCVGGPKALIDAKLGREAATAVAMDSAVKVATNSDVMNQILARIGINDLSDFSDEKKIEIFERRF